MIEGESGPERRSTNKWSTCAIRFERTDFTLGQRVTSPETLYDIIIINVVIIKGRLNRETETFHFYLGACTNIDFYTVPIVIFY